MAIVAYLLWLLLGWTGADHFYLGRCRHGLLWLTSFAKALGNKAYKMLEAIHKKRKKYDNDGVDRILASFSFSSHVHNNDNYFCVRTGFSWLRAL